MPVLRRCGATVSTRRSPNKMRPRSSSQKPATMRSNVVLPQPDGPSRVKNSPSRMASDTPSTARTSPKLRATPSMVMAVTPTVPKLSRLANEVLDLLQSLGAARAPSVLVVGDELHVLERRHLPRQACQIEILARGATEGKAQDGLAHVVAGDVIDEGFRRRRIGPAFDDGDALHLRDRPVVRIDDFHGRAVRGPQQARVFERHAKRELAVAHPLEHQ